MMWRSHWFYKSNNQCFDNFKVQVQVLTPSADLIGRLFAFYLGPQHKNDDDEEGGQGRMDLDRWNHRDRNLATLNDGWKILQGVSDNETRIFGVCETPLKSRS